MTDHREDKMKLRTGYEPSANKPVNSHIVKTTAMKVGNKTELRRLKQC